MNVLVLVALAAGAMLAAVAPAAAPAVDMLDVASDPASPPPPTLRDTGLLGADGRTVRADIVAFSPQYPLWSDGATKRRWIRLPAGTSIDASQPDAWEFPRGTRLWKEFSHGRARRDAADRAPRGRLVALRVVRVERGRDRSDARAGTTGSPSTSPARRADATTSRRATTASRCHEGAPVPVLGFSRAAALVRPRRQRAARGACGRRRGRPALARRHAACVKNLPSTLISTPPRIASSDPVSRAALGYLHANCGHCHNDGGALMGVDMVLSQRVDDPAASVERAARIARRSRQPLPIARRRPP